MPIGEVSLQAFVGVGILRVVSKPVAEGEMALFPRAALPAHMDVERSLAVIVPAEELVLVRPRVERPPIAEVNERLHVRRPWHHRSHRSLDVHDRLRAEAGYRGRADMFHANDVVSERRFDTG